MGRFGFGLGRSPVVSTAADAADGTRVGTDELIELRLSAGSIDLASRRPVRSVLAGSHGSRFRGRGMDYQESRGYQPGDDIRNMDWRVTARAGHPHTKLYQEERERPVVVMLDLNPGMFFGTRNAFKSVVAARAAALIGWATVSRGDRIGALLFNGNHRELQPRGGSRGVLGLIRALTETTDPQAGMAADYHAEGLNQALLRLRRVARPGSLVFVLSDFYGIDEDTGKHLLRLRQHNDLVAIQVVDALELAPPPPGRYGVSDGQRFGLLDIRSSRERERYRDYFSGHHRQVEELMQRRAVPLLQLATTDNVVDVLRQGLASQNVRHKNMREKVA